MLIGSKILNYVRKLWRKYARYNWMGWELPDRWKSHYEMGDVFMLDTPVRNWMYVDHPDIIMEIVRRKGDFPGCLELNQLLDVLGPNISSVSACFTILGLSRRTLLWLSTNQDLLRVVNFEG